MNGGGVSFGLIRTVLAVALMLVCTACSGTPIARDLNQHQANEIVTLLSVNGIAAVAEKDSGGRGAYSVTVDSANYARSITLITQNGLPSEPKLTFAELVEPQGILPNSREIEGLRLDHAVAIEMEDMLSAHPAVSGVKTIVRYHSVKPNEQAGVSVVAQRRAGAALAADDVRTIIQKVLPGIAPENIGVTIDEGRAVPAAVASQNGAGVTRIPLVPFLFEWRVAEEDHREVVLGLIAILIAVGAAGIVAGYWYGTSKAAKSEAGTTLPQVVSQALKGVDRVRKDNGES